ncbi:Gimap9 [Symbiodinium natans]|uniref:Gimap9 protein n=1 Tax=Symbiodinium natans TaxID=878477 RepID=A0A812IJA1_9DINO|nr:Gimap9 [Symbiodinium natans]
MPPLIFALVGKTGHGKSMTANSLSASDHFLADDGFESVTRDISSLLYTVESGQQFLCLDMPDVCDTRLALPERDTRMSKLALKAPYGLDALAFIIRKVRMTEEEFTSISQMEALFGSDVWKHAIFVFTHCAATSAKLEADLAKLGEEHILNKAIQKANGRA